MNPCGDYFGLWRFRSGQLRSIPCSCCLQRLFCANWETALINIFHYTYVYLHFDISVTAVEKGLLERRQMSLQLRSLKTDKTYTHTVWWHIELQGWEEILVLVFGVHCSFNNCDGWSLHHSTILAASFIFVQHLINQIRWWTCRASQPWTF